MKIMKIGVISTAHIHTHGFLKQLANHESAAIGGIWDDNPERGQRFASEFDASFHSNIDELLEMEAIDGWMICAENTRHLQHLRRLLPLGKPVFCEKPLVTDIEELKEVGQLLEKHRTPLSSGYFQPFVAPLQGVREVIENGALGTITRVRFRMAHHAAYGGWFDSEALRWFTQPALSGGGAFMDLGSHAIHLMRTFFGPIKEVLAVIENHSGRYPDVDDYGTCQLRFESGLLGVVEAAWTQTGGEASGLEVVGSEATLYHGDSGYVVAAAKSKESAPCPVESGKEIPNRVPRLLGMIEGTVPEQILQNDLAAIFDTVSIMAAAYASSRSGQWEKVASDGL